MTTATPRAAVASWLLPVALALTACAGEPVTRGLTEPISVESAQFVEGTLPGAPPLSDEELVEGLKPAPPNVTSYDLSNQLILPGEPAKSLRGRASTDALALGVRIEGEGSGYWLLPTRIADPMNQNELGWDLRAAFNPQLEPGLKRLLLTAIGEGERSGTQTAVQLCIGNPIPDNNNVCDPRRSPPRPRDQLELECAGGPGPARCHARRQSRRRQAPEHGSGRRRWRCRPQRGRHRNH